MFKGEQTNSDSSGLPSHIEGTVQAIVELHAEHHRNASRAQRHIDRAVSGLARPASLVGLALVIAFWIGANLGLQLSGNTPFDPPPFQWLVGLIAVVSLFMATLILAAQDRAALLASRREQMTLEVSILAEQKTAKLIQLMEELRRDIPFVANRHDPEATEMARPADTKAVLEVIQATHEQLIQTEEAEAASWSQ